MSRNEVNYFGASPVLPNTVAKGEEEPFDNAGDEQLEIIVDGAEASVASSQPVTEYTRATVPRGAWIEVDLGAIADNVKLARKALGARKQLMAIVKADAYGHGAVRVSQTALAAGADRLGVATVEEAVELRMAGIMAPILLLSQPPMRTIPLLIEHRITATVCTTDFALALGEAADVRGTVAPFHLAVDTGMNRIGVFYLDVVDFLHTIDFHRGLKYEGTFTHFATADEKSDWDFRIQLQRFNESLGLLKADGIAPGIVHAGNSATIFRYPEAHFDMVRLGICMYGLACSGYMRGMEPLKPAMSVKAQICYIKEPQLGEGVSYGLTYRVANQVLIATLPIGYADGLSRRLSGHMEVLCNERRCLQVGTICMDQMMIEVSIGHSLKGKAGGAQIGDEVVIIGVQGNQEITLDTMADELGTINYELACLFGIRLPKIYV